jgi:hypothetical protein
LIPLQEGFSGVLVTDFYAGYDSMPCPQQKCLVHLIRDINADLLSQFHDEELKGLARSFGALLVKIVATIDKYGLRRDRLHLHKSDVDDFYDRTCERPYQSEVAEKYRKRLLKFRGKLFTFLDYNDVPWNNNNAEHAVKHFAKYRMIADGRMTANGLQSYLVLLSIYQTCVYKGVSFLRFLLSGEKDVDAFTEAKRGHRRTSADLGASSEAGAPLGIPSSETPAATDESGSLLSNSVDAEVRADPSPAKSLGDQP